MANRQKNPYRISENPLPTTEEGEKAFDLLGLQANILFNLRPLDERHPANRFDGTSLIRQVMVYDLDQRIQALLVLNASPMGLSNVLKLQKGDG